MGFDVSKNIRIPCVLSSVHLVTEVKNHRTMQVDRTKDSDSSPVTVHHSLCVDIYHLLHF